MSLLALKLTLLTSGSLKPADLLGHQFSDMPHLPGPLLSMYMIPLMYYTARLSRSNTSRNYITTAGLG